MSFLKHHFVLKLFQSNWIFDHLDHTGTNIGEIACQEGKPATISDRLKVWLETQLVTAEHLDEWSKSAQQYEGVRNAFFCIHRKVLNENSALIVPPGCFVFQRTLGNCTASGLKVSFVEKATFSMKNLDDLVSMQKNCGEAAASNLLLKFWEMVRDALPLTAP